MPIQPDQRKRITRLIGFFGFLGLAVTLLSFIPFDGLVTILGRFEPDGRFDSLGLNQYQVLVWIGRSFGLLCLFPSLLLLIFRESWSRHVLQVLDGIPKISLRSDFHALWLSLRGDGNVGSFWLAVVGLSILAIFVRVALVEYPVRYDEAYTFIKFSSRPIRYILTDYSAPNNHIFHSILVALSYRVFGISLWALRLPALTAGVLSVVAAALAGRRLYGPVTGMLAASGIVLSPLMIDYSVNARGYTLICLFAFLGLWLAAELIRQSRFLFWALLVLLCALGFYTIPIFLYPAGIIFLWLGMSGLAGNSGGVTKKQYLIRWWIAGVSLGLSVFLLYLPVLFFGTGLNSITSNEFVQSLSWADFVPTMISRMQRVWETWTSRVPAWLVFTSAVGFFLHLVFSWRKTNHRIPLALVSVLWIGLALVVQRVTPLPRMWIFLLGFYLLWAAMGWCSLVSWFIQSRALPARSYPILFAVILLVTWAGYRFYLQHPPIQDSEESFNEQAARYIANRLPEKVGLVGVSPTIIQVSYYLRQNGIPSDLFYDRDRPQPIAHAWVVVVEKSRFPSVEEVLAFQRLEDDLNPATAKPVFSYKRLTIYDVTD